MQVDSYVLAYDFGTGGCKSSVYNALGDCIAEHFESYNTYHNLVGYHEQKPADWWKAVKVSTSALLSNLDKSIVANIKGIGSSGHSLGMLPMDKQGNVLLELVPIWSDSRPEQEDLDVMFSNIDEEDWYMMTGNGFPANIYTVFKVLWLKRNQPEVFNNTETVIGTKDYINFMLTGNIATDPSYASGTGVYDLQGWDYSDELLYKVGLDRSLFPRIIPSDAIVGEILPEIARELGLPEGVQVVSGGVDNSCMALGAKCIESGRIYNSLGSSSWIALCADAPVLDEKIRPFVFAHVLDRLYISATSIFSAGTSLRWFKETITPNFSYGEIMQLASKSEVGSSGVIFNPTLSGGTNIDPSPEMLGGFFGLSLGTKNSDIARSVVEGVAISLSIALDELRCKSEVDDSILIVGGGSKSDLWCQILSDAYRANILRTNIGEQAAALGAAALALVGIGAWDDYSRIDELHKIKSIVTPIESNVDKYKKLIPIYKHTSEFLASYANKVKLI